jgi:ribosomal protein L34E
MREINLGKVHSEETKEKMSKSHMGEKNHNYQKTPSYEQRCEIAEARLGGFWYGNVRYYQGPQYCEKFNNEFKERVRAYFGYVCPICGTPQGKIKMSVHHVNFNKKSCCDPIAPRLFIPLCSGACHINTNTSRKFWEEYFTDMIMNYYQGKCYFTKEEMKNFNS